MESNCGPTAGKCKNRISPAVKLTLATFGKVPIPASEGCEDLTFVAASRKAKAAVQIVGSFPLS